MGSETELKLRLSPADARRVGRLGILRGIKPATLMLENIYYDTADHTLAKRRIALRHRRIGKAWLITVKSAKGSVGGLSTRAEWEYPCAPGVLDFSGVEPEELRHFLDQLRPTLTPVYSTNFKRRAWMFEPHRDLSVELALDEGQILASPPGTDGRPGRQRSQPICELELELKQGTPLALYDIALRIANKLALLPENESKAQRGLRLYRGIADAPAEAAPSLIDPEQSPLDAFRQLADDCLNHFLANLEGVRTGDDPEYIHQARVALRRLRALIRVFAPVLPDDFVLIYNEGWRHFANQLGDARDLDVLLGETLPGISRHYDGHDAIETFIEYVATRRQEAHESARASFHSLTLSQLILRFLTDLARLPASADGSGLKHFSRQRLRKRIKRIRSDAVNLKSKTIDDLHRLRIQFKRLRYAVEFFAPLFDQATIETYLADLKAMQDTLGKINDLDRALAIGSKAPAPAQSDLVEGWLSASQQALIGTLPAIAHSFVSRPAPWEPRK